VGIFQLKLYQALLFTILVNRFEINGTRIVPLSILGSDPVVVADIQRRKDRCRRTGGIGAAVVLIQCGRISQVMPVEVRIPCPHFSFFPRAVETLINAHFQVDSPAKIPWASTPEWEDLLCRWVDCGTGSFEPP